MIQPLRTGHRWTFEVMGILLPVIFLAGLAVRPSSPKATDAQRQATGARIYASSSAWKTHVIKTSVYSDGGTPVVQLMPAAELQYPDLLLYWSPASPSGDTIARRAKLLGAFEAERRYSLPEDWRRGNLILYSVARKQVIDAAPLDQRP